MTSQILASPLPGNSDNRFTSSSDLLIWSSGFGHDQIMTSPEARRLDLYNGLTEFLGEQRADTLMAYLPGNPNTDLATRADLESVERRLGTRMDAMDVRFNDVLLRLDGMTARLDRMVQALIAGLVAVIATLVAQSFI